ncbi:hypothetical protein [Gimesia algae]|uniref:Uncharacterized protein n=1 Tax=Gimesia algae TaxID=2527971 RepID=A0A517VKB4_9PLAN|nr:hypothetical protein [Gimesia algae]QDT93459.1 hypothetical protein Pan161_51380 [Gimesia algae]
MISEESETNLKRIRIRSGVMLFVCIALVSALLIYWIQSRQMELSVSKTGNLNAEPAVDGVRFQSVAEAEPADLQPDPVVSASSADLVLTQTAFKKPLLPDLNTVKEGELESTSWQNPFYKLFWKSQGWQFTEEGMESAVDQISVATFNRPYQKISVSFRVQVEKEFPDFELQLLTRNPEQPDQILVSSVIHFQNDAVSISESVADTSQELKQIKLDLTRTKPEAVPVRLVGTGNRFVVSIGRRRVLTCAQPALQSGKECFLCFITNRERIKLTSLRIEGE